MYRYAVNDAPWCNLAFSAHRWSNSDSGYNIFFKTVLYEEVQHKTHKCISFHTAFNEHNKSCIALQNIYFSPAPHPQ